MIQLPDYLVRKVSGYPAGMRMPKMIKYYEAKSDNHGYRPLLPLLGNDGDPLSGGDYRYWCGATGSFYRKGFSTCRGCGEVCFYKNERKEHKKKGCGNKLEEAYKMLSKTKECVICKLATKRKVYGLPFCCKDCEFEWEFTTTTPSVLRYVLEELKD